MNTRLSLFCGRVIEAGWMTAAAIVPVFFNLFGYRMFELAKVVMLRSVVVVMVLAWAVKTTEAMPRSLGAAWRRFLSRPLVLPVLCLALIYVIATITSVAPAISFWGLYERMQGTLTALTYFTLFLLVAFHLRSRVQFHRLVNTMLLASFLISVYGVMQHFGVDPVAWSADVSVRVIGTMGNPIFFAAYLIMVVPLTVARLLEAIRPMLRRDGRLSRGYTLPAVAYLLLLLTQLAAILFTNSRGPWLGLVVAMAALAILLPLRRHKLRVTAIAMAVVALVGVFLVLLNVPGSPVEGVKRTSSYLERLGSLSPAEDSIRIRLLIWRGDETGGGVLGMITASPRRTIIGYGPDTMFLAFGPFSPVSLTGSGGSPSSTARSHNDLLDYVAHAGVLGLLAYLAVIVSFYFFAVRYLWRTSDFYEQLFGIALMAAVTGYLVETFVGIAVTATQTQFWLYLGAMVALVTTGWQPAPVAEPQAVPRPVVAPRKKRLKERRKRRVAAPASGRGLRVVDYTFIAYLVVTFAITLALVQGVRFNWPPSAAVAVGFLWVILGMLLLALWVPRLELPRPLWRASRWWLYMMLIAGAVFALVVLLKPLVADIFFKMGELNDQRQQYQRSLAYLAAISYSPDQDFYYLVLGRSYLKMARSASGGKKVGNIASVSDLFRVKGWTQLGRDDLLDASLVALAQARRLNGLRTDNWVNLAELHRYRAEVASEDQTRSRELEQAVQSYQKASGLMPNASYIRYRLGLAYHQQQDYDNAAASFRQALKLGGKSADTYDALGRSLAAQGKSKEAAVQFRAALNLRPDDWAIRRRLAQIYWDVGQATLAVAELEAALKVAPSDQRAPLEKLLAEWMEKEKR